MERSAGLKSVYEMWVRLGLVTPGTGKLSNTPHLTTDRDVDYVLADLSSDH